MLGEKGGSVLDELGSDTISHDYFLQSSFQKEAIDQ